MSVVSSRTEVVSETCLKGIALGLCFCPLLYLHFRQLWAFQHYQYFPLILLILPLLIRRLRVSQPVESAPANAVGRIHRGLLGISWVILLCATLGWSPNLAAVAAVSATGAALLWMRRTGRIREGLAVWFLLWTLVRLPLGLDIDLIFWLQGVTSLVASQILESLGIDHVLQGHVIRIPGNGFLVEEACSGIQSLFTLIAFTAATLCIVERSVRHSVLLLVAAAFWAALINTLRVTLVVVAAVWFSVDIASGFAHELLGMVLFLAAAMLLVSTDSLLSWCFLRANEVSARRASETVFRNADPGFISRPGLLAFLLLAAVQLGVLVLTNSGGDSIDPDDPQITAAMSRSVLPERVGDWKLQGYDTVSRSITNYMGRNSVSWTYTTGEQTAIVSVDYPFLGWHEVENCYESQGCIISDRVVLARNAVHCSVKTPEGALAGLWYSQFTKKGDSLTPLGNNAGTFQYWRSRVQSSFLRQTAAFRGHTGNYQVQLLVSGAIDSTSDKSQELTLFHREMAQRIVSAIQESVQ